MIDITPFIIDDLTNDMQPDEHLNENITVMTDEISIQVYYRNEVIFETYSITQILEFLINECTEVFSK